MINLTKELPQNTIVVQSEHTEQHSKVPMTASSRGSLWYPHLWHVWDNILGILSTMDSNLRCYMHLWCRFLEHIWSLPPLSNCVRPGWPPRGQAKIHHAVALNTDHPHWILFNFYQQLAAKQIINSCNNKSGLNTLIFLTHVCCHWRCHPLKKFQILKPVWFFFSPVFLKGLFTIRFLVYFIMKFSCNCEQ